MNVKSSLTHKCNWLVLSILFVLLAGNVFAGPVIIDGTDASDHGYESGGVNYDGWLYMQKVLENLAAQVNPGVTKVVVDIGTEPGSDARAAIDSAFNLSSLPAAGWTLVHVNGATDVANWLAALSTSNTGILALPTSGDLTDGDIDDLEQAALNAAATNISNFTGQGGGLHAMMEDAAGAFGWLTTLIPGITPTSVGGGGIASDLMLTPAGNTVFPGLTNAQIAGADPWHGYFGGTLGGLQVLATAADEAVNRPLILGGGAGTTFLIDTNPAVSDQKPGSLLVFPYYTSNSQTQADTRITISNVGALTTTVHVLYLERSSCAQQDEYLCLTPNASISVRASQFDPENSGYIIAYAVNPNNGLPTQANRLIGSAFIKDGGYVDNYGAEAFWKSSTADIAALAQKTDLALLNFDGYCGSGNYDLAPCSFAVEIQSPKDASGQRLILAGLQGDTTGQISAATATPFGGSMRGGQQVGIGQIFNGRERPFGSFSNFIPAGCLSIATISDNNPKIPFTLGVQIPSGDVGTMQFNVTAAVGLLLTPNTNRWSGIRTLHKIKTQKSGIYVPVFMPTCT